MSYVGRKSLSVVIPCYNEAEVLDVLLSRLYTVCEKSFPNDYEIVLVNDGSSDETWDLIQAYSEKKSEIVGVNLAKNHGHQLALSAGLEICTGELIFILDADLQDPPELLPEMVEKIEQGYDVVYGQRKTRAGETYFKKTTAHIFYRFLNKLVDVHIPNDTGDFRLMTRRVLEKLISMPERFRFIRGMVSWVGFSQTGILYNRDERFAGETKYPLKKMVLFALDAITSFSILPLRLAISVGMIFAVAGLVSLSWVAFSWANGQAVEGWASVISLVLILGSLQLLMMGVMGEYIGRMYMETKKRPMFIIQDICRFEKQVLGQGSETDANMVHEMQKDLRIAVND